MKEQSFLEKHLDKTGNWLILSHLQTFALTHPDFKSQQDRLAALSNLLNAFGEAEKLQPKWSERVTRLDTERVR